MSNELSARVLAAALICAAAACGDDEMRTPFAPTGGDSHRDASTPDAARAGGGGADADAGAFDHVIRVGDLDLCGFDDADSIELPGDADESELGIAAAAREFALVYHADDGALWRARVAVDGEVEAPQPLAGSGARAGAAALASTGARVVLAFRGAGDAAGELRVRSLDADEDRKAVQLSDALATSPSGGELFALLALDDGFVAAFVEDTGGGRALRIQRLDAAGEPDGDARTLEDIAARAPEDLHLARLDAGRVLLAWFERDPAGDAGDDGRVMGVTLSPELEIEGEPLALSKYGVHGARFDLAARSQSAGLIYHARDGATRDTVKFRRVDGDGQVTEAAFNVVDAPGRAIDGSIAAFGQGYAVAYRVLPSLGVEQAAIRVAFINQFGAIVYEAELAPASENGGRTTLATTTDGHLLVGWTHLLVSTPVTRAIQLYCPGALELCGGAVE
jgi:hypothetical protein